MSSSKRAVSRAAGVVIRLTAAGWLAAGVRWTLAAAARLDGLAAFGRCAGFFAEPALLLVVRFDAITLPLPDSPESAQAI
ncbi:MAG TPA: hypothetical protein VJ890_24860 [Vineibacter sp.]|nr:hypothetical protein [Vineibacter sp.]